MSGNSDPECLDTFLFDLDGTLIDSIELILRCYRHAAATHLSEQPPTSVWRDGLGTPLREQFRAVTSDADLIETMVVTYREFHNEHHDSSVRVYPDVEEVLRGLRRRAKLGVVTSKLRAGAERGLKLLGLFEFFDVVVTADIPLAARCMEAGARVLGTTGREFTEDSIGDRLAMRELKADLRGAGVMSGGPPALSEKDRSRFLSKLDELVQKGLRE